MLRFLLKGTEEERFCAIESWLGPGVRVTPVGLVIESDVPFDQWRRGLRNRVAFKDAIDAEMRFLKSIRFCAQCGRVLPAGSTARRKFCTDACRVAAYRRLRSTASEVEERD